VPLALEPDDGRARRRRCHRHEIRNSQDGACRKTAQYGDLPPYRPFIVLPIIKKKKVFLRSSGPHPRRMVSFVCDQCQDTIKKPKLEAVCSRSLHKAIDG